MIMSSKDAMQVKAEKKEYLAGFDEKVNRMRKSAGFSLRWLVTIGNVSSLYNAFRVEDSGNTGLLNYGKLINLEK